MTILRINWRNDIRMIEIKVLQAHQGDCIWVRCISEKTVNIVIDAGTSTFKKGFRNLVKEINNSDSQKYAILTTTDSFYRYKEAVKELIEKNLGENETRREGFVEKLRDIQVQLAREEQEKSEERNVQNKLSIQRYRLERAVKLCDEANEMLYRISREFDAIERRLYLQAGLLRESGTF
mgnify:FL=1